MNRSEIYFLILCIVAVLSFGYAVTHMPQSTLEAIKQQR